MAGVAGLARSAARGEHAGAFQHHVDVEIFPRQRGGILDRPDGDLLAIDDQVLLVVLDRAVVAAMGAVVLQQAGQGFGVGDIVDADDLEFSGLGHQTPEHQTADAAETINTNSNCHCYFSFILGITPRCGEAYFHRQTAGSVGRERIRNYTRIGFGHQLPSRVLKAEGGRRKAEEEEHSDNIDGIAEFCPSMKLPSLRLPPSPSPYPHTFPRKNLVHFVTTRMAASRGGSRRRLGIYPGGAYRHANTTNISPKTSSSSSTSRCFCGIFAGPAWSWTSAAGRAGRWSPWRGTAFAGWPSISRRTCFRSSPKRPGGKICPSSACRRISWNSTASATIRPITPYASSARWA